MAVVYVDSVFVLNTIMDYLLFLVTARLSGIPLRRRRYLMAALLGGVYAVTVFLPGLEFLTAASVKLVVGVLLALTAYGEEEQFLRLTLLFFAVSCGFAGCVLGLGFLLGGVPVVKGIFYTDVNTKVLAAAFAAGYLVVTVVFRAAAGHGLRGELLPVRLWMGGKQTELTALWDSGNALRDPTSGQPILVLAPGQLDAVLPKALLQILISERLRSPADLLEPLLNTAPELRPRLMPYHAVGMPGGLLLTICVDKAEIAGEVYPGLRVALSPTGLGSGYGALWGGEIKKGGRHGTFAKYVAAAAESTGAAVGEHSLYWGE